MPLYRGKGVFGQPGFEMEEFEGFHVSSCGKYWGSEPFTKESERDMRRMEWKERMKNIYKRRKNV